MNSRDVRAATRQAKASRARLKEAKKRMKELMRQNEEMKDKMARDAPMLEGINKKVEELLKCPMCVASCDATAKVPCILECGHTFCGECMIVLVAKAFDDLAPNKKSDWVDIRCPTCQFKVSRMNYPLDLALVRKNEDVLTFIKTMQS
uniref:RING-type domain-containing protein n=1 Tax=Caenorhabditis tropicalis TaxID=1561998 RepID=A0A1I7TRN8_9PELO